MSTSRYLAEGSGPPGLSFMPVCGFLALRSAEAAATAAELQQTGATRSY